ncbi:hypothetical protein PV669_16365 [Clostridioides difficile]|nr:hypothetical protein [Clostridioides difficile]MCL6901965.1 hypothetical protein [Clostridioides difficile]MCP3377855.1 hypothetical protein [Clostridioides difficile]MDE3493485.1 hypothetical protein [Clostridioides difficile]MDE3707864.1 hypothetical protein [Clostridioides difficile]
MYLILYIFLYIFSICIYSVGMYSINSKIKSNKENYELLEQGKKGSRYIEKTIQAGAIPIVNFCIGVMLIRASVKMDDSEIKKCLEDANKTNGVKVYDNQIKDVYYIEYNIKDNKGLKSEGIAKVYVNKLNR